MPTNLSLELDKLSISIDKAAKAAYMRLIKMLEDGTPPQKALDIIYLSFDKGNLNAEYVTLLSNALTKLLERPFTPQEVLNMRVGDLSLSSKLYVDSLTISKNAARIINDHLQGMQDLRKLALSLFSGYDIKSQEVLKVKDALPEYLKKAVAPYASEIDKELARLMATDLKTPALRAAYLQYLDKVEAGAAKKALDKALRTAAYEKSRYLANRLAQTEAARAYAVAQAKKLQKRDDVHWVQLRPSGNHEPDICDLFLKPDRYGKGAGVYPLKECPTPVFHPHCRCKQVALVNVDHDPNAQRNDNAEREYLAKLSADELKGLLPAGARLHVENGGDLLQYINQRTPSEYQIRTIAETF